MIRDCTRFRLRNFGSVISSGGLGMSRMSAKLSTPFTTRRSRRTPLAGAVESISPFFLRSVRGLSDGDEALAAKPHFSVPRMASWKNFWKRRKPKQQRQRTKCCVQSCALFVSKKTKAFFPAECVTNRLRTLVRISLSLHDPRKVRSPVFYYQHPFFFHGTRRIVEFILANACRSNSEKGR